MSDEQLTRHHQHTYKCQGCDATITGLAEVCHNLQELERIHEALPSEERPQEDVGPRRPTDQEEQVRELDEILEDLVSAAQVAAAAQAEGKELPVNYFSRKFQDTRWAVHRALEQAETAARNQTINENTSDGYHTFKELYRFRKLYNAALFNKLASGGEWDVHKSYRHSDGELAFGGGWFVVSAQLPSGQITNHYENSDWELFQVPERDKASEWDGHTAEDVATRLEAYVKMFKFTASDDQLYKGKSPVESELKGVSNELG